MCHCSSIMRECMFSLNHSKEITCYFEFRNSKTDFSSAYICIHHASFQMPYRFRCGQILRQTFVNYIYWSFDVRTKLLLLFSYANNFLLLIQPCYMQITVPHLTPHMWQLGSSHCKDKVIFFLGMVSQQRCVESGTKIFISIINY